MDLKSTYNKIAEDWALAHNEDSWWVGGTDKLISFLKPKATVLDVGCGSGVKSKYLASAGLDVTGIDFSDKMIEIAKEHVPEAEFEVVDIYKLAAYPRTFDCIFAQAVLLHIPKKDIKEILKSIYSKINPNGLLYIAVKKVKEDNIEEKVIKESDYGYDYERFFSFFTVAELKELIADLNMKIIWENDMGLGSPWIQIIAQKI
jgi:trans-aconitate methyltransferase